MRIQKIKGRRKKMIGANDKVSNYQLAMIVIMTVIGVGVFNIGEIAAKHAGPDGWLVLIIMGLLHILLAYVMIKLGSRFPGKTFPQYIQEIIGVIPGKILVFIMSCYIVLNLSYEVREFTEVAKMFLLPRTPTEIIMLALILVSVYVVRGGVEVVARIVEILFPILFIPFFLIILAGASNLDLTRLLPIGRDFSSKFTQLVVHAPHAFSGIEYILFYLGFVNKPHKAFKPVAWGIIFVTFFYTLVSVIGITSLGQKAASVSIWPLLVYIRNISLPELFLERLDGITLSLWVMTVFTTIVTGYYIVSYSLSEILNTKEQKQFAAPLLIIIYYFALQPASLAELYSWGDLMYKYVSSVFIYIIPVVMLIIAALRRLGVKKHEEA
jgi:spore germination protein